MRNDMNLADDAKQIEAIDNVLGFPSKLKVLRKDLSPNLVKKREGWRDRNGNVQMVDYVEWHTVADILDLTAPSWTHEIKDIKQIAKIITVTVAITIDGITRQGIGTGFAESESGIKKAEHDALKRAAVKFGVARNLYRKKESQTGRAVTFSSSKHVNAFPADPLAKSLSDMVTAKQLGMIKALSNELRLNADEESKTHMNCGIGELSKSAASSLITHLQDIKPTRRTQIRRAG